MKILHLIYDHINNPWVGGGGAVRCFEINRRLAKKGHEITVVSGNYPDGEDHEKEGIRFKFVGSSINYIISVFSYAYEAMKFLKRHGKEYDIVIEDFAPWNPVFTKFFHKNVILQLHQKEGINIFRRYFIFGTPFMAIESYYPKFYKNIITVSEDSKRKFKVNAEIIPNGISDEFLIEGISRGQYIGYLGRIDIYHKGLDLLLDALSNINLPLYIAGKGKDEKKLKSMIIKKRLKDKTRLIGFVIGKDKFDFIKNAMFFVMPSRYEGQSIVTFEVAALGKPIIVSDIPEFKYVTENGFGINFRSEDVNSLREVIEYLLKNDSLIEEMGNRGKQYAKYFTWDKIAEKYERYLLKALAD